MTISFQTMKLSTNSSIREIWGFYLGCNFVIKGIKILQPPEHLLNRWKDMADMAGVVESLSKRQHKLVNNSLLLSEIWKQSGFLYSSMSHWAAWAKHGWVQASSCCLTHVTMRSSWLKTMDNKWCVRSALFCRISVWCFTRNCGTKR